MKIKIFYGTCSEKIETDVNAFIEDKKVIDIKQSAYGVKDNWGRTKENIVITVMYEEK